MTFWSKLFDRAGVLSTARGPAGHRAYVVGDIHGRLDLLRNLLFDIERDIAKRPPSQNVIVFLGDLIDRGPSSAGVVECLRTWSPLDAKVHFLCGNHEEMLLRVLAGENLILSDWLRLGGAACLNSYGLAPERVKLMDELEAIRAIRLAVPASHQVFLKTFADTLRFGDYLLVHAGIRPKLDLVAQTISDLRWIRTPFLEDTTDHGFVVVHGHSISENVEERPNRIGIDTGAYRTGRLTAIAIEDGKRWYLDTKSVGNSTG